jgi:hypothetical protein
MEACGCGGAQRTGFEGVPFAIRRAGREGEYADWTIKPVSTATHIPGTNTTYVETMGYPPARVTWAVELCCRRAYHALLARYRTEGTLTVLAGLQSLRGRQATHGERVYEELDRTLLHEIGEVAHLVGGGVRATVTFWRAVDPVTREAPDL